MDVAQRPAPVLETGRLRLRGWRRADFEPWYEIMKQPEVHRHFGPSPISREDAWRRMLAAVGSWSVIGFGGWAVERRDDCALIGTVSLFNAWRALEPQFGDEPEIGWIFAREAHGKGLAGEACRAALDWAEANLPPSPVWAIISPGNAPSFKLAEKLGFAILHDTAYNDEPITVLKRPSWA